MSLKKIPLVTKIVKGSSFYLWVYLLVRVHADRKFRSYGFSGIKGKQPNIIDLDRF